MRSLLPLMLISLVIVNLFGFYSFFIIRQVSIRNEISENIAQEPVMRLQHFTFTQSQFDHLNWTVAGKEFNLDGHLYDIAGIQRTNGAVEVTVEYDASETELVDNFLSLFSSGHDKDMNSSPLKTIISHFQQDYITALQQFQLFALPLNHAMWISNQKLPSSLFAADKTSPPPQFFLV